MNRLWMHVLALALLAGLTALPAVGSAEALPRTLTPHARRISDEAIARDLGAIDSWGRALDSLLATPGPHDAYRAAAMQRAGPHWQNPQ